MSETIKDKLAKDKLAKAEFWTFEAKHWYDLGTEERAKLHEAHKLIVEVMTMNMQKEVDR